MWGASLQPAAADRTAPIFAALGDETRLTLVARLNAAGPLSIARLTEGSNMTRQAVTKHLNVLAGAGLVRSAREGRESIWELSLAPLAAARLFLDRISGQWDERIERLRQQVEGQEGLEHPERSEG